jgi:hypothetical protein
VCVAAVGPPLGAVPPHREPPTQEKGAKRGRGDPDSARTPCSCHRVRHPRPRPRPPHKPGRGTPGDRHPASPSRFRAGGGGMLLQIRARL